MKTGKILKMLMLLAAVLLSAELCAEPKSPPVLFKRIEIRVESVTRTPIESTIGGKITAMKLSNPWLLVFIDYIPSVPGIRHTWRENMSLDIQLFVAVSKKQDLILTGKIPFRLVNMDGRKRTAVMAVPPHFLDMYIPRGRKAALSLVKARVVFRDSKNRVVGRGYLSEYLDGDAERRLTARAKKSTAITIENSVLPREKTPWRFMNYDQTDLVLIE